MKRLNFRREDGVAMTEFALILPIFMVIVAGHPRLRPRLLLLDPGEPRRERDRALGDRGSQPVSHQTTLLGQHAANSSSVEFNSGSDQTTVCIQRARHQSEPRRSARGHRREAVRLRPDPRHRQDHDPCLVHDARRAARSRVMPPTKTAIPKLVHRGSAERDSRAPTSERGQVIVLGAVMIPVLPAARRARHRRRQLVHAQAAAPESRRRGRICRGRRIRQELESLRADRPTPTLKASTAQEIADFRTAVRRRSGRDRLRPRRRPADPSALRTRQIANQSKVDVAINSTSYDITTRITPTARPGLNNGDPCYAHTTADSISASGVWTDVKVQGARPALAVRRDWPTALSQRRTRARRDQAGPSAARASSRSQCRTTSSRRSRCATTRSAAPGRRRRSASRTISRRFPQPIRAPFAIAGGGIALGASQHRRSDGRRQEPSPSISRCRATTRPAVDYVPVGVEVRVASQDDVDLNLSCAHSWRSSSRTASTDSPRSASGTTGTRTTSRASRACP